MDRRRKVFTKAFDLINSTKVKEMLDAINGFNSAYTSCVCDDDDDYDALYEYAEKVIETLDPEDHNDPRYDYALIFEKEADLAQYALKKGREVCCDDRRVREVRLIVLVRRDNVRRKIFCRIHCPINPFPIKGEFEPVSIQATKESLEAIGWRFIRNEGLRIYR